MPKPQFTLKVDHTDAFGIGSRLFFEGQEIKNVTRIEVSNTLEGDEPKKTRLIIDLIGEVATVE